MMKNFRLLAIGIVIGLALVLGGWMIGQRFYTYQGSLIDPPVPAADFTLTDQHGDPFQLSAQRDKVVLIFFGYTRCPDVCPVTLTEFLEVKRRLGKQADNVQFVMVTVDPERDTQGVLGEHLARFDPTFIGLTGSREELEAVWKSYGVFQQKVEMATAAGYLVDHTSRTYAIDRQGNWRLTYPFGMEVEKLAEDVLHLLKE